jgi:hypothetical protein
MGRKFLDGGYCPSLSLFMNRDSSVDIVTRLQTLRPMVPGIVLTSVRFHLFTATITDSLVQSASLEADVKGSIPGVKRSELEADHIRVVAGLRMLGTTSAPHYVFMIMPISVFFCTVHGTFGAYCCYMQGTS